MAMPHHVLARWLPALLVAAASSAACGTSGATSGGGAEGSASCAALLEIDGVRYLGHGDLRRRPQTTDRRVEVVVPSCDDTGGRDEAVPERAASAQELVGVPVGRAVMMDGALYLRRGTDLPPAARAWFEPVTCDHPGDGDLRPPYRLDIAVDVGPAAYVGATVTIQVSADTRPALGPDDVRATLWTGGSVTTRVRCAGDRFTALSVRSSRSAG